MPENVHGVSTKRAGPVVSIALATYEGEKFLRDQLQSFLTQTLLPDEVVIADDNSGDATVAMCREFQHQAPFPVRIMTSSVNLGYTGNFERALSGCRGDVVFFSDQDDVWHPRKIETMMRVLEANPGVHLAVHDVRYCDQHLHPSGQTKLQRLSSLGDPNRRYVTGMATTVRRSLVECALPIPAPGNLTYDSWLHECALALKGKMLVYDVLADYRRHGENATMGEAMNEAGGAWYRGILKQRLSRPNRSIAVRAAMFRHIAAWLRRNRGCIVTAGLASEGLVCRQAARYEQYHRWAEQRLHLLDAPRAARVYQVIRLAVRGGYEPFSGVKSVLADLVRTRTPMERP